MNVPAMPILNEWKCWGASLPLERKRYHARIVMRGNYGRRNAQPAWMPSSPIPA